MKTFKLVCGMIILLSSSISYAKNHTLFWVKNNTEYPIGLCVAEFTINEEKNRVCSKGASTYCSTEQLLTLENNPNQQFKFTLTRYKCLTLNEEFKNIDSSCQNRTIEIKSDLTTISIEGQPSNILSQTTQIVCNVKA